MGFSIGSEEERLEVRQGQDFGSPKTIPDKDIRNRSKQFRSVISIYPEFFKVSRTKCNIFKTFFAFLFYPAVEIGSKLYV